MGAKGGGVRGARERGPASALRAKLLSPDLCLYRQQRQKGALAPDFWEEGTWGRKKDRKGKGWKRGKELAFNKKKKKATHILKTVAD